MLKSPNSQQFAVGTKATSALLLLAIAALGCSSSTPPATGSGGSMAAGGTGLGSGGQSAGTGGVTLTGGTTGSGGLSVATGGTASAGTGGGGGNSAGSGGARRDGGVDATVGTGGQGGNAGSVDTGTGGAAGAGMGGAGGTTVAFAPCPMSGNCVVMPLGDSITDGFGVPGGYRIELFRQALTDAKHITFVGRNINGPASVTVGGQTIAFPRNHEGYSGYTIDNGTGVMGISPLVDAAISMFSPHIVLLMIGTNDVNRSIDLPNAPTRLGALLDRITTDAPKALVVIAKINPTANDVTNPRVMAYNSAIPGLVQSRNAAGKHIVVVDMYAAFTANPNYKTVLMNDELHPNTAGYLLMAQTWYAALTKFLR